MLDLMAPVALDQPHPQPVAASAGAGEQISSSSHLWTAVSGRLRTLVETGALRELRTQVFMPWILRLWDTPNVAHDNPTDQRFHASVILGFADANALRAFFGSGEIARLSGKLPEFVSAVHAYEVTEALTYVKDGKVLPNFQM